jgi:hypothetical protein
MLYIVYSKHNSLSKTYPAVFNYEGTCEETGLKVYTIITDVDINMLLLTDKHVVKYQVV